MSGKQKKGQNWRKCDARARVGFFFFVSSIFLYREIQIELIFRVRCARGVLYIFFLDHKAMVKNNIYIWPTHIYVYVCVYELTNYTLTRARDVINLRNVYNIHWHEINHKMRKLGQISLITCYEKAMDAYLSERMFLFWNLNPTYMMLLSSLSDRNIWHIYIHIVHKVNLNPGYMKKKFFLWPHATSIICVYVFKPAERYGVGVEFHIIFNKHMLP